MRHLVWSDSLEDRAAAILKRERRRLEGVVEGELLLTGGCSVPGVLTAGDIDLHLRVDPQQFGRAVEALSTTYPVAHPEIWNDSMATFGLPDDGMEIAVTPVGSTHDRRFVDAWRRIQEDGALRATYNKLKEVNASADEATYLAAKRRFFDRLATEEADGVALQSERDVKVGDGRIVRTASFGDPAGFPVIWHHGNPGSRVAPISEDALRANGVWLITYDRPGGGGSDPLPGRRIVSSGPDVGAIADAWGLGRFGTIGFSGGGSFALATAALLGDRVVAAAVLAGAAPIDAEDLDFTAGMADAAPYIGDDELHSRRAALLAELEPTRQAILSDPYEALRSFIADWPRADHDALRSPDVASPIADGMAECVRVSAEGWFDDGAAFHRPWGFDVTTITVPVAIWHGREDVAAPITHGRWLAGRIRDSELHELDGGHYAAYLALSEALGWLAAHA